MDYREAVKWAAYYHAVSLGAAAVGLGVAGVGAYFGLRGSLGALAGGSVLSGQTWGAVVGAADLLPLLVAVPLGLFVWRVGRTTARLKATAAAADAGVDLAAAGAGDADATADGATASDDSGEPTDAGFASGTGLGPGPGTEDAGSDAGDDGPFDASEPERTGGATMAFGDDGDDGAERATLEPGDGGAEDADEEFAPFEPPEGDEDR